MARIGRAMFLLISWWIVRPMMWLTFKCPLRRGRLLLLDATGVAWKFATYFGEKQFPAKA